ncbi:MULTISPECIES: transcriptional regulator GfcR [unclassified Haladaptatus]|uniref:transcriptional regulator GfcR n=1 Tax=unclassified Haladaptatus TaxID=2622732 RepID=UPI0023E8DD36|nr:MULTISPECIES: transcriptional regulator GfcR [unclassified Haladaptatus]
MKNVDDLIESASELANHGLSKGEIADELNVSRETAKWLVEQSEKQSRQTQTRAQPSADASPDDIHVDWSSLGRNSQRLSYTAKTMANVLGEAAEQIELTVGIEKAGVPLATAVARSLDTELAAYAPAKHRWESGDIEEQDLGGSFSRNFAQVRGRKCVIVDDTITSGTTMTETIEAVEEEGGEVVACVVLVDKQGVEELEGVPVHSLVQVMRVDRS